MSASEPPPDLRAPLLGVAVWAGAWCGVVAGFALLASVALMVGVGLAAWRWRSRALLAAGLCVGVATGVGVLNWWVETSSPLTGLARQGAVVEVEAAVTGDPVIWPPHGVLPGAVTVQVSIKRVQGRGQAWALHQDATLVLADGQTPLVVGGMIQVKARASLPDGNMLPQVRLSALGQATSIGGPGRVDQVLNRLRAGLRDAMGHSPPDQAGLVPGMVVGDTSGQPPALREAFRVTSLSYLTAVSGLNLTLMIMFLSTLAKLLGAKGWWLRGLTLGGTLAFVALCRAGASVVRAATMSIVGLAAAGVGVGAGRGLRRWGIAVMLVCLTQPAMSHSWGFAMSAVATAGILWWVPPWTQALRRWAPAWLAELIALPLAAQIATQPLVTALSGQVSVVGVLANLVVVPFIGPVIIFGLTAALVSPLSAGLAGVFGWLAGWCAEPIILAANAAAALPGAQLAWGSAQWGATAIALVVLALCCWLASRALPQILMRWWATALVMVMLAAVTVVPKPNLGWPGPWTVAFCDVGQGDATVLQVEAGVGVLVDAGPDPPALRRCLADLGVSRLALVVISHQHADHIGGALDLAHHVHVDQVLVRAGLPPLTLAAVAKLFGDETLPVSNTWTGQVVDIGPVHWVTVHSGPLGSIDTTPRGADDPQENNSGTIGLAVNAGLRVLFTGDAEPEAQAAVLFGPLDFAADVLKVPHHGSAHQDAHFLAAVDASVAVVSVGQGNSYGHPAAKTMDILASLGMSIFRTDQLGALTVCASQTGWQVRAQHRSP